VLKVTCGELAMLLCADAGRRFEQEVLRRAGPSGEGLPGAQVLKVGHHGSSGSASAQFLEAVGPEVAVVSVGRNSYGHPAADTVERLARSGANLLRTDLVGAVRVVWRSRSRRMIVSDMRSSGPGPRCSESSRRWDKSRLIGRSRGLFVESRSATSKPERRGVPRLRKRCGE